MILVLMLLAIGCKLQTPEQDIEKLGQEQMKALEKDDFSGIKKMILNMLKYPETYKPISTDMSIVTSNMLIYNTYGFGPLRDLNRAIKDFNEKYGDGTLPQSSLQDLDYIQDLGNSVHNDINDINHRPVEFEGIDVYHQFYANDRPDHVSKKGYHFIVHKNGKITLLCDHDDFLQVKTLIKQWFNYPSYSKMKPDSLDNFLNMNRERVRLDKQVNKTAPVGKGKNNRERSANRDLFDNHCSIK